MKMMLTDEVTEIEKLANCDLPSLSATAMRVAELVQDLNAPTGKVADVVGSDPALAARILRAANSPLYSLVRRVTTLPAAVIALGGQTIHALAVVSSAADSFDSVVRGSPFGRRLWQHSVETGMCARTLSHELGMRGSEEAFLCGLLHDIGKLVMIRHDKKLYAQVIGGDPAYSHLVHEINLYGFSHAQVGALVTQRWELPEEIGHAIYNHHDPSAAKVHVFMARLVDVANRLSHAAESEDFPARLEELAASDSGVALRLTAPLLQRVWEDAQSRLPEVLGFIS